MDELEISKIFGAGCAALLAFVGFGQLGSAVVSVDQLDEAAYVIEVAEDDEGDEIEVVERMPIGQLMAMADMSAGEKVFKKCSACHKVEEGAANGVGPALYGVVGRDIGGVDGYSYSGTLEDMGGQWDFAALDGFLEAPKKWAPGTKMGFAGLSKEEDRASLIAWLNEKSASPLPMPAIEATAETEPAEEAAEAPVEEVKADDVEVAEVEVETEEAATAENSAEKVESDEIKTAEVEPAEVETKVAEAEVKTEEAVASAEEVEAEVVEAQPVEEKVAEADAKTEEVEKTEEPKEVEVAKVEEPVKAAESAPKTAETVVAAAASTGLMALADMDKGKKVFRKCKACHKVKADKHGVGPSLHGVVGRDIASVDGFKYSDALMGKDGKWDVEALNAFLLKPKEWAPGTKMAFGGLRKEVDRASIIAWLNEQSDNPLPLE